MMCLALKQNNAIGLDLALTNENIEILKVQ